MRLSMRVSLSPVSWRLVPGQAFGRYKTPNSANELGHKRHLASPPFGSVTRSRSGLRVLFRGWLRSYYMACPLSSALPEDGGSSRYSSTFDDEGECARCDMHRAQMFQRSKRIQR